METSTMRTKGELTDALEQAVTLINSGSAGCVVIRDGNIVASAVGDGIRPIIGLCETNSFQDAFVVDKIVGKAAAMLMVLGGAKGVYGLTMSEAGLEYLQRHKVTADYGQHVAFISNRKGDGMCPMEQTVENMDDPKAALLALRTTLARLSGAQVK